MATITIIALLHWQRQLKLWLLGISEVASSQSLLSLLSFNGHILGIDVDLQK